ncbi:hypothetical protein B9Z55_017501 [Caenorhabditis nigoni]|uniref:7TM GPCR serpentine receptor class x (Srx) domain-containing protein n=1 Tax=Caenorhabditis nigoni TaxID=1611254 RepID=A0A2G5T9U1_9PELO|nr:hypothetical protein B9Z55_017501 [Caenorhabditis nigoni]
MIQLELNPYLPIVADTLFDIAGCLNLVTNCLVVYLILFQSSVMKEFRYYLLYIQLTNATTDFWLAFLAKPVHIYPVIGGYSLGILYSWFGISCHVQATVQVFSMALQKCAIFCAFLKKHQSIVAINDTWVLSKFAYWGSIIFVHGVALVIAILYYNGNLTKEQQLEYIRQVRNIQ